MGYWVDQAGNYYEGDEQPNSTPVPQRPDYLSVWNGSAWVQSPALVHAALVQSAQSALVYCTDVAARCTMAGIAYPSGWQTYAQALKAIVNGTDTTSTSLPAQPAEPPQAVLYQV